MPTRASNRNPSSLPEDVEITYKSLRSIKPYDKNPRINEPAVGAVINSIKDFGFLVPIVVDTKGVIVAGHTRYMAATRLGMTKVPCIEASHLTPEQIRTFRVIDNKTAELADWDMALLTEEISALVDSGINLTQFGWTQEDIDCLSDMVADDCISAGTEAGLGVASTGSTASVDPRAPTRTRFVMGEIVFFIDREIYRRWIRSVRAEHDGVEADIIASIKDHLGITAFETAGQNRRRTRTH